MLEPRDPEIKVDDLMASIRAAARRSELEPAAKSAFSSTVGPGSTPWQSRLPRYPAEAAFESRTSYVLADFLNFHDAIFVRYAYRGILGREPDAGGWQNYLDRLRSGQASKIEILGRLRYSPEGRAKAVRVRGLLLPFAVATIGRLPLLGYPFRWLVGLLRLPILIRNFERFESYALWRFDLSREMFNQGMAESERLFDELHRTRADRRWVEQIFDASASAEALRATLAQIEAAQRHLDSCRTALAEQQQQLLALLGKTRK